MSGYRRYMTPLGGRNSTTRKAYSGSLKLFCISAASSGLAYSSLLTLNSLRLSIRGTSLEILKRKDRYLDCPVPYNPADADKNEVCQVIF